MNTLLALIKRDTKLFFKDKGTFFTSLVIALDFLRWVMARPPAEREAKT